MKTTTQTAPIPENVIADAKRLGIVSGNCPVIGWLRYSPRRGSYAIRFFPVGAPAVVQNLGQGVTFTPALDTFA